MNEATINFYSENDFQFGNEDLYADWIQKVITSEGKKTGEISYIFCDDEYLLEMNKKYLDHDTYTDIISFDNTVGKILQGDIFISIERVAENTALYEVEFEQELRRVMIHGILHFAGYTDKTEEEKTVMRGKEEEKLEMFHVEQ